MTTPTHHRRRFTAAEISRIFTLQAQGHSWEQIGAHLGRTPEAVRAIVSRYRTADKLRQGLENSHGRQSSILDAEHVEPLTEPIEGAHGTIDAADMDQADEVGEAPAEAAQIAPEAEEVPYGWAVVWRRSMFWGHLTLAKLTRTDSTARP